jgi:predicted nucleotidyltransferase
MNPKDLLIAGLIKAKVKQKDPLADVILFGSHARGNPHKDSDWDILILLNHLTVNRSVEREFRDEIFDVELEIGEPISTFVFSKNDWETKYLVTPLYRNIKNEGILL